MKTLLIFLSLLFSGPAFSRPATIDQFADFVESRMTIDHKVCVVKTSYQTVRSKGVAAGSLICDGELLTEVIIGPAVNDVVAMTLVSKLIVEAGYYHAASCQSSEDTAFKKTFSQCWFYRN
jgi:hypothetical protein